MALKLMVCNVCTYGVQWFASERMFSVSFKVKLYYAV